MFYLSPFQWNISMYRKQTEQHKLLYFWSIELIYHKHNISAKCHVAWNFHSLQNLQSNKLQEYLICKSSNNSYRDSEIVFFFDVFFEKDPHFNDFELTTCLKVFLKKFCQRRDTGCHCIKYTRIRVFSDPYSPVQERNYVVFSNILEKYLWKVHSFCQ